MKSFCIKTNNHEIINYLLDSFLEIDLDFVYLSHRNFAIYENIILHYKGFELEKFYKAFSEILCNCIITFYEAVLIKKIISTDYFYFSELEKKQILDLCINILEDNDEDYIYREEIIQDSIYDYIVCEKSMILDGFIRFRLYDYIKLLDSVVDIAVNRFLIEKEYLEFINILRIYVNSGSSTNDIVHLIYNENNVTLVDENKKLIPIEDEVFKAKYLSDISFSKNDYILNTLLNILPNKIIIHSSLNDEFINTLKLIFESRISICHDCHICQIYNNLGKMDGSHFHSLWK